MVGWRFSSPAFLVGWLVTEVEISGLKLAVAAPSVVTKTALIYSNKRKKIPQLCHAVPWNNQLRSLNVVKTWGNSNKSRVNWSWCIGMSFLYGEDGIDMDSRSDKRDWRKKKVLQQHLLFVRRRPVHIILDIWSPFWCVCQFHHHKYNRVLLTFVLVEPTKCVKRLIMMAAAHIEGKLWRISSSARKRRSCWCVNWAVISFNKGQNWPPWEEENAVALPGANWQSYIGQTSLLAGHISFVEQQQQHILHSLVRNGATDTNVLRGWLSTQGSPPPTTLICFSQFKRFPSETKSVQRVC